MDTKLVNSAEHTRDIILEMVILDALSQIYKLTGYSKDQMLLALIKITQEWLTENIIFH